MQLKHFGFTGGRKKTLIVLGAGATRGSSFVRSRVGVLPPLDTDFFQQLSRLDKSDASKRILEFVRSEYGHESGLTMEQFFSEADYTDRFHHELNVGAGPGIKKYRKALEYFYQAISDLFTESINGNCIYHDNLAAHLNSEDVIVNFNYDCTMDLALKFNAKNRWDPAKRGYGFEIYQGAENWRQVEQGRQPKATIKHLKMHGSVNWRVLNDGRISLYKNFYNGRSFQGRIIPPTWFKDLTNNPYDEIWKQARMAVRSARIIVVVGYSVPQTDLFSRSLFKVEAGSKRNKEKLDLLVLVNPDRSARTNYISLISGGLEPSTRVIELDTLQDLHDLLSNSNN